MDFSISFREQIFSVQMLCNMKLALCATTGRRLWLTWTCRRLADPWMSTPAATSVAREEVGLLPDTAREQGPEGRGRRRNSTDGCAVGILKLPLSLGVFVAEALKSMGN